MAGYIDRPEAAVTGNITEEATITVGGANDDAGSRVAFYGGAISVAVFIVSAGDEGFYNFHIHLLDTVQLRQFQDPVALELFRSGLVLHIGDGQRVGEPILTQNCEQRGLAHALLTIEDEDGVKLDAGAVDSSDGCHQRFAGNCPDIGCIFCTQIVDQQGVQTRNTIPLKSGQVVLDGVIQSLGGGNSQQSVLELSGRPDAVGLFKIQLRTGYISIAPARLDLGPGQLSGDIQHTFELIEHDVLKIGIVAENNADVGQCIFDTAGPVKLQLVLPILIGELCSSLGHTFLCKHSLDPVILQSQFTHGIEGWHLANGGIRCGLFVQIPEQVDTDNIKCVQQFSAGRVGGMMAVCEFAVIQDNTSTTVRRDVVIAAIHGRRCVNVCEEGINGVLDGISTAECTHNTGFGQRIGLLGDAAADSFGLTAGNRPSGSVVPVGISTQIFVGVQIRTVLGFEEKLTVSGGGRPVHQTTGFIGGVVEQINSNLLGYHTGDGSIFFFGDLPGQRNEDAQTGMFRGVLMGGIYTAAEVVEQFDGGPDIGAAVVHIQRQHGAAQHHAILAATFPKGTAHEATHILDGVLGTLLQLPVLFYSFGGADRGANLLAQILPGDLPVLPLFIHTAIADCNFHTNATSLHAAVK